MEAVTSGGYFVRAEELVLGHGGRRVTPEALTFELPRARLTAVVGANGAGKTTLLRALVGERVRLTGTLLLYGREHDISLLRPSEISHLLAFVPQEHHYPGELRVSDMMRLAFLPRAGIFGRLPSAEFTEIRETLRVLGLSTLADTPLKRLSTGERQKAFLARAILQHPRLLILDEPTNHLDPGAVFSFWEVLQAARSRAPLDVLVSTHDLSFVRHHAEWILALSQGKLIYNGEPTGFWEKGIARELYGKTWYD